MRVDSKTVVPFFAPFLWLAALQSPANQDVTLAYIDPGSGHLLIQLLVAAGAGSLFYLKAIRTAVMRLVSRVKKPTPTSSEAAKANEPQNRAAGSRK